MPADIALFAEIAPADPVDVLPRDKCEEALRRMRRARWYEVSQMSAGFLNCFGGEFSIKLAALRLMVIIIFPRTRSLVVV